MGGWEEPEGKIGKSLSGGLGCRRKELVEEKNLGLERTLGDDRKEFLARTIRWKEPIGRQKNSKEPFRRTRKVGGKNWSRRGENPWLEITFEDDGKEVPEKDSSLERTHGKDRASPMEELARTLQED